MNQSRRIRYLIFQAFLAGVLLTLTNLGFALFSEEMHSEIPLWQTVFTDLLFNLTFSAGFIALLSPLYILISTLHPIAGESFVHFALIVLLTGNAALNHYAQQTHLSLGSDLYGYTLDDILFIVGSSTEVNVKTLILFLIFPALLIAGTLLKREDQTSTIWFAIPLILSVFSSVFLADRFTETSRLAYFVADSWNYWQDSSSEADDWKPSEEYPLLRPLTQGKEPLNEFLNHGPQKPNIVILVVEGLGSDFMGAGAEYPGFTPFLDSLSKESLYWSNFMSNTGRSFGALPSILGSAPFGKNGFLDLEELPDHISLISLLKKNGYHTSYFEGGQSSFDNKNRYLNQEGIDLLIDQNSFDNTYRMTTSNKEGFSWGYPDSEIYRKTLSTLKEGEMPRLDIILSISNHEPFQFPDKQAYVEKARTLMNSSELSDAKKRAIEKNIDVFASLLYTDESIRELYAGLKKRADFDHTLLLITGDHRLIPVPQKDQICRYHVPLIVHSPLQKEAREFKGVSSHLDITPSLARMLAANYGLELPAQVPWLGNGLSPSASFESTGKIPLMKYKGSFSDYVAGTSYLSGKDIYKLSDGLHLEEMGDAEMLKTLKNEQNQAERMFRYATLQNKIIPDNLVMNVSNLIQLSDADQKKVNKLTRGMNEGEIFFMARDSAHHKHYDIALLLLDHLNNLNFNHFDGRTLRGRIYGWTQRYPEAEKELRFVIERSPLYQDAYAALLDLYWWNDAPGKAREIAKLSQTYFPEDKNFQRSVKEKLARFEPTDTSEELASVEKTHSEDL